MEFKIIKTELSFDESTYFIRNIVRNCFETDDNENDIDYLPEFKDVSIKQSIALYYTDIKLTGDHKTDMDLYSSIEVNEFSDKVNGKQLMDLLRVADEKIEFRKQKLIHTGNSPLDTLIEEVTTIVEQFGEGFDLGAVMEFIKKFNESGLTAKGLMDEYMNSDMHKSKEQEVIDAKNKQIKALVESMPKDHKPKKTKSTKTNTKKKTDTVEGKVEKIEDFREVMNPPVED